METLESLSDALKTTGDIQSIVRTMKALSSVSIRQYERAEEAMADYARTVDLGLMALLRQRREVGLRLPGTDSGGGRKGLIVISHVAHEDPGMSAFADFLRPLVPEVPVRHEPTPCEFWTV